MEIYNNMEGLGSLLGLGRTAGADGELRQSGRVGAPGAQSGGADRATLSSAASSAAQMTGGDGVRAEKVAAVQAALASGTYSVPAVAVASKVLDAMLSGGGR